LQDGRVIIFGGEDNGSVFPNSVWAFDPSTERFSQISELATGRVGFVAVKLLDGDVLIAGGIRSLTASAHAELINGDTGAVRPLPGALQRDRVFAAASLLPNGTVLISGGQRGGNPDNTVEIYDPATDTFSLLSGTLQVGRAEHTSVRINERRVLIYGGYTADGQPAPPELYDPVAATSTLLAAPEPGARARHGAHTMIDGGVLSWVEWMRMISRSVRSFGLIRRPVRLRRSHRWRLRGRRLRLVGWLIRGCSSPADYMRSLAAAPTRPRP
jgi:hypothetical protein